MHVNSVHEKLRQEYYKFEANLGYPPRPYLKRPNQSTARNYGRSTYFTPVKPWSILNMGEEGGRDKNGEIH